MKQIQFSRWLVVLSFGLLTACSSNDRSRDFANAQISGVTMAQQVCSTCHGMTGESSNPLFPKLAGQQSEYILNQLESLKGRDRNSEHSRQYMWGPTRLMTAKQMDEIATYFSNQVPMQARIENEALFEKGQSIYHQGVPKLGVKACASCHGDQALGEDVNPRLAGQHAEYIVHRARVAMTKIVANLSDDDIASVAYYLESIGQGGKPAAVLKPSQDKLVETSNKVVLEVPAVFDSQGKANNCHYSVWTYGWYCGSFSDALIYHLTHQ